jgi:Co/Zn/Cd efflux system component
MSYGWWKFIHLAGVVGFVAAHGTSMAATLLLRRFREPQHVAGVLQLSAATVAAFYVSTTVLLVGGIGAGVVGRWFDRGWIWVSLGLLIGVGILMFPMARRHFRRIRMVLELMETGTAVSRDDFVRVLNSGNPVLTAGTGFVAILLIVYLMVLKPF